jgi:hypothetical protein
VTLFLLKRHTMGSGGESGDWYYRFWYLVLETSDVLLTGLGKSLLSISESWC